VHLLLQFLPSVPVEQRKAAAERLLAGELSHDPELAEACWREAATVMEQPELGPFFTSTSRAEVAIVGTVATARGKHAVSGRIDRLIVDPGGWRLIDFKTDRGVPASAAEISPPYILQLALYRRLLMEMSPGVSVDATLVFTAGPKAMPIPADLMEQALDRLGVTAIPVS
jgi:ATP-dependent helicase/nuclease subunit A